jgi:two-component system LytT family response regulator
LIESLQPDLALLDLQMPELDGMGVVQMLPKNRTPLVAFVTAYDEHAVEAFERGAIDYVLKPFNEERLAITVERLRERVSAKPEPSVRQPRNTRRRAASLHRIPVRRRDEIVLVPVNQLVSIVAEGEWLHLRTTDNESHTICYRLRDLLARLEPAKFVRLGRGTAVNIDMIRRIIPLPGGTFTVVLADNQEFRVSRIQSRLLREQLLRL